MVIFYLSKLVQSQSPQTVHVPPYTSSFCNGPVLLGSGTFSLWCHPKFEDRCQSVVEFIKRAIMHSKNGKFLYFLRSRVPGKCVCLFVCVCICVCAHVSLCVLEATRVVLRYSFVVVFINQDIEWAAIIFSFRWQKHIFPQTVKRFWNIQQELDRMLWLPE